MPKKVKEKQRRELMEASSSDDEDSDVEKNFTLLTDRGGGQEDGQEDCEEDEAEGNYDGAEEEEESSEEEEEEEEESAKLGGSSQVQTEEDMKRELSNMSFEDIMKLQNKVGTKVYSEVAFGSKKTENKTKKKRLNKNRPVEVSSKRRAPFLRQVVSVRKPTLRDPRFDDLSGEYKAEIFDKTYRFIDDIKSREKQMIQKQLRKTKTKQKMEKLQFLLERMENQEQEKRRRLQQRERELHMKRQQRERAGQGAAPFFLKKSEKKKLQLAEKYQELKKSGKLENFLSKKRRRNAVKDRRKLPGKKTGNHAGTLRASFHSSVS